MANPLNDSHKGISNPLMAYLIFQLGQSKLWLNDLDDPEPSEDCL